MTEIDDRLNKLIKEFDKMLGKPKKIEGNLERLIRFGFTLDEAKGWLEQEPNYQPSDETLQRNKPDEDLTEP